MAEMDQKTEPADGAPAPTALAGNPLLEDWTGSGVPPFSRIAAEHFPPEIHVGKFYRPVKQQISLRVDADVLAWFKKDGRRYQTRINEALRKVMEREMR